MFGLNQNEVRLVKKLSSPKKIQDFLNALPFNFEKRGETCMSPRRVLREGVAHCLEGALLAALALRAQGQEPLLLDLTSTARDDDHVVALFRFHGRWGAISKTNHAVLRYREPVYSSVRELAMSYFHEYFLNDGKKTLRSFSVPVDLRRFDRRGWATDEKDLWYIVDALDNAKHTRILRKGQDRTLRLADAIEIEAGKVVEWERKKSKIQEPKSKWREN